MNSHPSYDQSKNAFRNRLMETKVVAINNNKTRAFPNDRLPKEVKQCHQMTNDFY